MNKNSFLKLGSFVLVVVLVIVLLSIKHGFRPIRYSPTLNNISTDTPYVDIIFNNPLSKNNLSLYSPQGIVASYSVESTYDLRVIFKLPISANKNYQIVLTSVYNTSGNNVKNLSIGFEPSYQPPATLSKQQTQYITSQQDKPNSEIYGTTLVNLLPFLSPGNEFLVNYAVVDQSPYITITGSSQKAYSDALTWIASQGYNASKLNIKYINQSP